jgi:hypothetical protein
MGRLITEARARGGNAIMAMRFDATELGDVWKRDLRLRHRGAPSRPPSNWAMAARSRFRRSGLPMMLAVIDARRNLVEIQNGRATVNSQTRRRHHLDTGRELPKGHLT